MRVDETDRVDGMDIGARKLVASAVLGVLVCCAAPATPEPSIESREIMRVVRAAVPNIRRCYEVALREDPNLTARIAPSFTIGPEGTVIDFSCNCADTNPKLVACVEKVFRSLEFPAPRDGGIVKVSYPFNVDPVW